MRAIKRTHLLPYQQPELVKRLLFQVKNDEGQSIAG